MADQDRQRRVTRALANLAYFHVAYVAPFDPNWNHERPMPAFAQGMLRFAATARRGVVMLPPEYLKTTLLSQTLPLWLTIRSAYFQTQLRGMLLSEEEGMAAANLSIVAWHIEHNELIGRDFSDDRGVPIVRPSPTEQTWKEDAIIIDRPHPTRDPTWQAKGLDSKGITGRRLDWFIGDDVVTPRNVGSPTFRKRALDTFDLQIETRLVADAHALLCGNFNDEQDLLSTISRRPRWQVFKRPSLGMPGTPDVPPKESQLADAVPLWRDVWPLERLLLEYRDKPNRFRRIHLMDPRAEHGERLNVGWCRVVEGGDTPLDECRWYIGFDGAVGGDSDDLDFANVSVGGAHGAHLDLVRSLDFRAPMPEQMTMLGIVHDQFQRLGGGVQAIGVPKAALDRYVRGMLKTTRPDLLPKLADISIMQDGVGKLVRLEALGPYAKTGWLRFHREAWDEKSSDPLDQDQELTLFEQWRDFPHIRHDDKLDGLDLLIRTANEFALVGDVTWEAAALD